MTFRWQRSQVKMLISLLEESECLYNIDLPSYSDRNERKAAMNDMFEAMKDVIPAITMDDLKRKLKCLRTQYLQELREIDCSKKTTIKTEDIYMPKLWCFEQLKFLKPFTHTRKIANATTDDEYTHGDDDSFVSLESRMTPPNNQAKEYTQEEVHNGMKPVAQRRPYKWLQDQICEQMEEIDPEEQPKAVLEIQTVLYKYVQKTAEKRKHAAAQLQRAMATVNGSPTSPPSKRERKSNSKCNDEDCIWF